MNRRLGATCAALALVAMSACGPTTHDHLDLRNVTTDVVYGGQTKAPLALPGAELEPGFPSFIDAPIRPYSGPTKDLVEEICPTAAFSVQPAIQATANVAKPPKNGDYVYRMDGHSTYRGVDTVPGVEDFRRVEQSTTNPGGTFTFKVDDVQPGGALSQTTYVVDQRTGLAQYDGISIAGVITKQADGTIDQFAPATPIRILPLPADNVNGQNANWESAGTDGVHNITEQITGTITKPGRVDACGNVLAGWEVHATGRILSPTKNIAIDTTYTVAPQFGGLVISEALNLDGIDGGAGFDNTQGAQCTNGTGTVDNPGAPAQSVPPQHQESAAPCPGGVLHRQTESVITTTPARP